MRPYRLALVMPGMLKQVVLVSAYAFIKQWHSAHLFLVASMPSSTPYVLLVQTAVRRKEGRLQITGPNINIPKKQLRAQWPAILERLAPQDVQAHMFVDNPDQYISCAAKIIATKAKVRRRKGPCMQQCTPCCGFVGPGLEAPRVQSDGSTYFKIPCSTTLQILAPYL